MSAITREDVEYVARLARLALSDEEKALFAGQLADILSSVNKLNELNTEGVQPTAHAVSIKNVMRPDKSRPAWPKDAILANAPAKQDGFFRVPRIMEEE